MMDNKISGRRCVKSPGGECHDLFGAEFNGSPRHQRVLKPPGGGSSDLFGPGDEAPQPAAQGRKAVAATNGHFTSSVILTDESVTNGHAKANGHGLANGASQTDGAPVVTTNGVQENGGVKKVQANGSVPAQTQGAPAAPPRQRVPPGGYSSGLW